MLVRLEYHKVGKIRFLGHRDVARVLERSLRRAGLPLRYSEGFSPRPRLSFGLALSTGYESIAEYLDIDLLDAEGRDRGLLDDEARDEVGEKASNAASDRTNAPGDREGTDGHDLARLGDRVNETLPPGLEVTAVAELDPRSPSLQQAVTSCSWEIDLVNADVAEVESAVARTLAAVSLPVTRERKGKPVTDDLRPLIRSLNVVSPTTDGDLRLLADLGTQPRAIRPTELLGVLDPPQEELRVRRTHQWIDTGDQRFEPLEANARQVLRTGKRAR